MVLTPKQIAFIDNEWKLAGYPKSHFFTVGYELHLAGHTVLAADSFLRGATNDSCVACMFYYADCQLKCNNVHLALPWWLEGALRGHVICGDRLIIDCYQKTKPIWANAIVSFWAKVTIESGDTVNSEEKRKEIKKKNGNLCRGCLKEKSENNNDVTLVKCGICKYYSYCGKDCQTYHWKEGKHMTECRQLILLRKYCKPSYIKEIREAIIGGQDPKEIRTLQRLRMKLGLNRPKEDYEELLLRLNNNDDKNNNNINNKAMKRGTKVKVKGLVKVSEHNGKFGIITKVLIPSGEGGRSRVRVKLSDDSGTVLNIKIENLELTSSATVTTINHPNHPSNSNRPNPYEYLIGRKDGTVHIGSTPNTI